MLNALIGTKQKMGQTFEGGVRTPVTYIKTGPCIVTQIKTPDKDGYWAVQLGFGEKKIKNVTKPLRGHLKGAKIDKVAPRFLREIKTDAEPDVKIGDTLKASDVFSVGDKVSVGGISKGKGFAGVVKRWGFAGGPKTHGQSDRQRAPGSIGQGTDPGRVWKGKKMAGRMGTQMTAVLNLEVLAVDDENNVIAVSGPIPGGIGSLITIKVTQKTDKPQPESPDTESEAVENKEEGNKEYK